MNVLLCDSTDITDQTKEKINKLVAQGFGQPEKSMHDDTLAHIESAKDVQVVVRGGEIVAFALYSRLLWR